MMDYLCRCLLELLLLLSLESDVLLNIYPDFENEDVMHVIGRSTNAAEVSRR
jgi:hypothetical protein